MQGSFSRQVFLSLILVFLTSAAYSANTWWVDDDAPNDPSPNNPAISDPNEDGSPEHPFDEIAVGMIFAQPGDVVIVRDGVYAGQGNYNLNFLGEAITVRSENGSANCTIDCAGLDRGFYFHTGETADTVVQGFTIINGIAEQGGGMHFASTTGNPTIRDCRFINCTATGSYGGGGACVLYSSPTFDNCEFINNTNTIAGRGALAVFNATILADRCRFVDNNDSGILSFNCDLTLRNSLAAGNAGYGVQIYNGQAELTNCTIVHNTITSADGAGIWSSTENIDVFNCIVWGNIDSAGDPNDQLVQVYGIPEPTYSCIQGYSVPNTYHNINTDPLFVDPAGVDADPFGATDNDYHLSFGSPCVDAGSNDELDPEVTTDCDSVPRFIDDFYVVDTGYGTPPIVDMGAFERQIPITDGDFDSDGDVDLDDAAKFINCLQGPGQLFAPGCEIVDFEPDLDVDLADFLVFQQIFTGQLIDCNGNGIQDAEDITNGTSQDCNANAIPDECDISQGTSQDCQHNNIPDECDIAAGTSVDTNLNGMPDECEFDDCNSNGIPDENDISSGYSQDCNTNGIPDECDIASGYSVDLNGNGVPDECDFEDCNANGIPDEDDISSGFSQDCNANEIPDECDIASGFSQDCQPNSVPDECDLAGGPSQDCNVNSVPDECDIASGFSLDCQPNSVPDECDIAGGHSQDCNVNGFPDECDIANGTSQDCQPNNVPDECDIAGGASTDTNSDGVPDECVFADCNSNSIPDEDDISSGNSRDCNDNGIPDECDIADGTSQDCQPNSIPDECDVGQGQLHPSIVHRWSFNTDNRDSIGTADAVLVNGAAIIAGSVTFDGVDDYAELPIADTIGAASSITIEAWVVWNGGGTWQRFFDIGTNTSNYMFLTPMAGGASRFAIRTPSVGEQIVDGPSLPIGELKHIAVTLDDTTDTATLFVDGSPFNQNTGVTLTPADLGTSTIAYLGKSFWPDPLFNGQIAEFRIYASALGSASIADSYLAGPDSAMSSSNDCNENGIPDECEFADCNNNCIPDNLDITNAYSHDCNSNGVPDECDLADEVSQDCQPNGIPDECDIASGTSDDFDTNGVPDECESSNLPPAGFGIGMNGTDGYVDLGTVPELAGLTEGEFTIEMWIKTPDNYSRSILIGNYDGNPSWNLEIHDTIPSGHLRVYLDGEDHHSQAVVTDNVWHHVAAVRKLSPTGLVQMFLDGQEVYNAASSRPAYAIARTTMLGRDPRPSSHYYAGLMDEVRVWNYARTEAEIQADMKISLSGSETGLIGYWPMEEGTGTIAADLVNTNNGTLYNGCDWITTP